MRTWLPLPHQKTILGVCLEAEANNHKKNLVCRMVGREGKKFLKYYPNLSQISHLSWEKHIQYNQWEQLIASVLQLLSLLSKSIVVLATSEKPIIQ